MAKRERVLPARKQRNGAQDDESLFMRSAESLGRMIGSLQRQLDGATRQLSESADAVIARVPDVPFVGASKGARKGGAKKKAARKSTAPRAAASRKTTSQRAAGKSGGARKAAATKRASASSKKR
jgi:hypothetical protein